jgi:ketosteroid isomerase-like protein
VPDESTTPDPVELVRKQAQDANRRDLDAVMNVFAENAILDGRGAGNFSEGRAAIRRFVEGWFDAHEDLRFEFEEISQLGNGVVFAVSIQDARLVGSAGHIRQREEWVYVWAQGLIARLTTYDIDEGRAAAERLAEERGKAVAQENVEIVREIYRHLALGNFWAIAPLLDPQITWDWGPEMALVEGTTVYHGPQGVEAATREWLKAWDGARIEPEEFYEAGEQVVAFVRVVARPKHGGPEIEMHNASVWTVRDGLATGMTSYSRAEALKAVGLQE